MTDFEPTYEKVMERTGRWRWSGHVIVRQPRDPLSPFASPAMRLSTDAGDWAAFGRRRLERKLDRVIARDRVWVSRERARIVVPG